MDTLFEKQSNQGIKWKKIIYVQGMKEQNKDSLLMVGKKFLRINMSTYREKELTKLDEHADHLHDVSMENLKTTNAYITALSSGAIMSLFAMSLKDEKIPNELLVDIRVMVTLFLISTVILLGLQIVHYLFSLKTSKSYYELRHEANKTNSDTELYELLSKERGHVYYEILRYIEWFRYIAYFTFFMGLVVLITALYSYTGGTGA